MKNLKYLIVMLFVSFVSTGYSQIMLGYTEAEIDSTYENSLKRHGETDNGVRYITVIEDNTLSNYYFEDGISRSTNIFPGGEEKFNFYVRKFDKEYTKVKEYTWTKELGSKTLLIEVFQDKYTYFVCTFKKKYNSATI